MTFWRRRPGFRYPGRRAPGLQIPLDKEPDRGYYWAWFLGEKHRAPSVPSVRL